MEKLNSGKSMFFGASPLTFRIAQKLRKEMTLAELLLWTKLKDRKIFDVKFRRQHPAGTYILDFYCHERSLAVEIDGEIHDTIDIHEKDADRTDKLNKFGIKVIRFSNDEIFSDLNNVLLKMALWVSKGVVISPQP